MLWVCWWEAPTLTGVRFAPIGAYPDFLSALPLPRPNDSATVAPSTLAILVAAAVRSARSTLYSSREALGVVVGPVRVAPPRNAAISISKYPSISPDAVYMVGEATAPPCIIGTLARMLPPKNSRS